MREGTILHGDALAMLRTLPDNSVHCCVTSPPYYGLRDYGVPGQLGLEASVEEYVARLVEVFAEVKRVLRDDGTLWCNLGDSYANNASTTEIPRSEQSNGTGVFRIPGEHQVQARRQEPNKLTVLKRSGLKHKDLIGVPWRVAFALQATGWWLRSDIIWAKPNPMPESVTDRPTRSHEYIFLLAKSERYYYDADAVREPHTAIIRAPGGFHRHEKAVGPMARGGYSQWETPRTAQESYHPAGRNKRSVWRVATQPYSGAHFATFPPKLIEPCILAGCPVGGIVLDPFFGSGTVGEVAIKHNRHYLGIELNAEYITLAEERLGKGIQRVLWSSVD